MLRFLQILLYLPCLILYPVRKIGKKNLPKGKAIFACNHKSNFDAFLLALNTHEKKYYLAKKELFKNKLVSGFFKSLHAIAIDRQNNDVGAVKACLKVLREERKLVMFPEGTRHNSKDNSLGEVKNGVAMFAIKAKAPIVPVYFSRKPKIFRRTDIVFGQPFELEEFYGKRLDSVNLDEAKEIVARKMKELREKYIQTFDKKAKVLIK